MQRSLLITGASGYVGRWLLRRMEPGRFANVVCLVRRPDAIEPSVRERLGIELVQGDLGAPQNYRNRLAECTTVVHLAALTGKAPRAEHFRVNAEGTRQLVETCAEAGVREFLHVSSIVVKFADQTQYFYAQAKGQAEQFVARSGLDYTIVRPTTVLGPRSGVLRRMKRLAKLPVMPVFGNGRARTQPIFVGDLADCLLAILGEGRFRGETIELGGPEVITIEALLNRIRRLKFGKSPRAVHLPLGPIRTILGLLERVAARVADYRRSVGVVRQRRHDRAEPVLRKPQGGHARRRRHGYHKAHRG